MVERQFLIAMAENDVMTVLIGWVTKTGHMAMSLWKVMQQRIVHGCGRHFDHVL